MGIDNSAFVIFGVSLDYNEFVKMVKRFMTEEEKTEGGEEDVQGFYYDHIEGGGRFEEKYSGLTLSVALPYYDSDFEDRTFFLYLEKAEEIDSDRALRLLNSEKHLNCLRDFDIEHREPKFIAVVDIN